jgi:hypothetical protein
MPVSPRRALPPALYRKFPFLQEVLDGMPASVKVVDSDYSVVWANARARADSGYDLPTLRGRTCHVYLGGFRDNCPWCPVRHAFGDGGYHTHLFEKEVAGRKRRMEVTGYLLPDVRDGKRYAVEITRDVTDIAGDGNGGVPDVFPAALPDMVPPVGPGRALQARLDETEKAGLVEALRRTKGDMGAVAREAGFSAKTLQRRLRKYGLDARDFKHPSS